jgi:hypothetical protein
LFLYFYDFVILCASVGTIKSILILLTHGANMKKQKFCSKRIPHIMKSDHQCTVVAIRTKYVKLFFGLHNSAFVFAVGVLFIILYLKLEIFR